jgi:hypothetical protein
MIKLDERGTWGAIRGGGQIDWIFDRHGRLPCLFI